MDDGEHTRPRVYRSAPTRFEGSMMTTRSFRSIPCEKEKRRLRQSDPEHLSLDNDKDDTCQFAAGAPQTTREGACAPRQILSSSPSAVKRIVCPAWNFPLNSASASSVPII